MDLSDVFPSVGAMPDGFPLPSIDAIGNPLHDGQVVRIPTIPIWLIHDLPKEDADRIKAIEGKPVPILGFDPYGNVWFGDEAPWFSVRPCDVIAVETRP